MFGAGKMRKGAGRRTRDLSFEVELQRFPDDLEGEFETLDGRVAHDVRFGEEAELGKAGRARAHSRLAFGESLATRPAQRIAASLRGLRRKHRNPLPGCGALIVRGTLGGVDGARDLLEPIVTDARSRTLAKRK